MTARCDLCGTSACDGAELQRLLTPSLRWLWDQVAAKADRVGDPTLTAGTIRVRPPVDPASRAEAAGLLGGRPLVPNQARTVDLAELAASVRLHGSDLTPGAVAAHATGRQLATRALARRAAAEAEQALHAELAHHLTRLWRDHPLSDSDPLAPHPPPERIDLVWQALRRSGARARLLSYGTQGPAVVRAAVAILAALPRDGGRADRRHLAARVLDDPHGLDDGTRVGTTSLALLSATSRVPAGLRPRQAWDLVGVDYDDLTGGLLVTGLYPHGWTVPAGAVMALPPRELSSCSWSAPPHVGAWVFVTENPSILGAAAGTGSSARLVCTVGTPSALEVAAIARIAAAGWNVAVRADFDAAGLAHVTALLSGIPRARPWRMGATDYLLTVKRSPQAPPPGTLPTKPVIWDPELVATMAEKARAGYEETLLEELLGDVTAGAPPIGPPPAGRPGLSANAPPLHGAATDAAGRSAPRRAG